MVAAVAALAMVSCNKEGADGGTEAKEPSVVVEFSASISMGDENTAVQPQSSAATRTTVDHTVLTNPKTLWLETDEISINSVKFKVKELTNGGASAVFVNAENLPDNFGAPYKAVYPYAAEGKITLPATQTAIAGHFPKNAVCAAAYSNDAVLKFKNVASVLMFQVAAECETVTISSDNALAGTVSMEPAGDDALPTFGEGTEKTVTINGPFEVGKRYYVAVLPGKKENFTVCLDGKVSKSASEITIQRSGFADMKTLPVPVVQTERELAFSPSEVSTTYGDVFTAPTLTGETAGVKYSSSHPDVATVDEQTGKVNIVAGGETVITATAEETETLKAGTASYTLKVAKASRNLAFSPEAVTAVKGEGFTEPTLNGEKTGVTYTSSNEDVATVDSQTGVITLLAAGNTTITATAEESQTHLEGTAGYALTVKEKAVIKINNLNGWSDLKITIKQGATTLASKKEMTDKGNNIYEYELSADNVGKEVTYYIEHSWYQTSTKTITLQSASQATPRTLNTTYLEPKTWDWKSATFGAWFFGSSSGDADVMVTAVKVKDNFFEVEIPATTYKNVIFVRCNKNNTTASWNTKWNQTADLILYHKCYCVQVWDNGGDDGWN